MKIAAFTSFTGSYLPNARVLAHSVKAVHPEWDFFALFNDRTPPDIKWEDEPFHEVVFADWLPINRPWMRWAYDYSVVEFCTATKGAMSEFLFDVYGYDAVVYLDPDVFVFSRFDKILDMMSRGTGDVFLTPHLTDPEDDDDSYAIWSHEMAALKHGTFNLGFFVIANRPLGRRYLRWWTERLLDHSHIDFEKGIFTDQKWCNLAPYMFDGITVLTDRVYNVATWNTKNRKIGQNNNDAWTVNGQPLIFYHFSGFGNNFEWADGELEKFAAGDSFLLKIWNFYKNEYKKNALETPAPPWHWGVDRNGHRITAEMRKTARSTTNLDPFSM